MPEENTVSLKIYLMEGNTNVEVRRFEVDQGAITNYDYLRERLQMSIAKLREKPFKVLWQDSDGDEVTISSDEELMIALSEIKSTVVKLIVRLPVENSEPEAHISISMPTMPSMYDLYSSVANWAEACPLFAELQSDQNCHACQQPITGFRYRCLECVQYYQCGECEHKNVHPDHVLLRMSNNPSLSSLIPKCMHILKSHFMRGVRCPAMAFQKMSHCHRKDDDREKEKRGHHKKFRKYEKHCGDKEYKDKHSSEPMGECPFNPQMFTNLSDVVGAFLGMYKDTHKKQEENAKQGENDGPSTSKTCPMKTAEVPAGPPMPASPIDITMEEDEPVVTNTESQKDAKIKMAIELLTEMGFNDENKWLSRLLEHFDGDIAKTLDHLTLGK